MIDRLGRAPGPGKLQLVKRGGTRPQYVLDYREHGGRRRRVGLSSDKRVAEAKARELLHERDLALYGLDAALGMTRTLAEVRDAYLEDLGTRACARHVVNVSAHLAAVLGAIRPQRVCELRPYDLVQYRAKRLAEGVSVRTANLLADTVRAMLGWAARVGLVATNPVEKLPRLKETEATRRCRRRAMTEAEIGRFLRAAADDDRDQEARVRKVTPGGGGTRWATRGRGLRVPQLPLWRAFVETGARYGELVAVRWADLDLDARVLHLRAETTKAGRAREIPLLAGLVVELEGLRKNHPLVLARPLHPSDRVFLTPAGKPWCGPSNNLGRIYHRLLEAALIDRVDAQGRKLDLHALRHTAATRFARAGMPLTHAQFVLGHSDPKLTARIYTHLDAQDVRRSMERVAQKHTTDPDAAESA